MKWSCFSWTKAHDFYQQYLGENDQNYKRWQPYFNTFSNLNNKINNQMSHSFVTQELQCWLKMKDLSRKRNLLYEQLMLTCNKHIYLPQGNQTRRVQIQQVKPKELLKSDSKT